ncbi:hypothetical protein GCM10010260_59570 [Streptomyces filipinensis]|uniref:Uncharacterized protein n=1 Tax=Streptomyces filipinensis TaxID=66887 RepID=A0A918IG05_9ACTN|nr:hypothetical protein GCM10010260_59570 [Streptomyces filipinensis]
MGRELQWCRGACYSASAYRRRPKGRASRDSSSTETPAAERGWDGPWYRVRTDQFEVSFLPSTGEDLDDVCNIDVEVRLTGDGSRWSATMFTLAEVERLMERWSRTSTTSNPQFRMISKYS